MPLLRSGISLEKAAGLALASDTVSIAVMEVVDNALMFVIPGAMDAEITELRFWLSLAGSLAIAGIVAFPVVRFLISRGRGHAVIHGMHGGNASTTRHDHSAGHH